MAILQFRQGSTTMIHPEVAQHIPEIRALCREFGVDRLEIFGSATTGHFDPVRSDADFLVALPVGFDYGPWGSRFFSFEERLSEVLKRDVDVITLSALQRKANPYFTRNVNETREVVFDARDVSDAA